MGQGLTFVRELLLRARFQLPSKGMLAGEFDVSGHIVISCRFKSVAMMRMSLRASPVSVSIQEASDERREGKEHRRVAMRGPDMRGPDSGEGDQALGVRRPT